MLTLPDLSNIASYTPDIASQLYMYVLCTYMTCIQFIAFLKYALLKGKINQLATVSYTASYMV